MRIPQTLAEYTLRHFGKTRIGDVFGQTEQALYDSLIADDSTECVSSREPVFYVDRNFDVYPNDSTPAPYRRLGNLHIDGPEAILTTYAECRSPAQTVRRTVPLSVLAREQGNPDSRRLFGKGDYIELLLNRYCRAHLS